MTNFYVIKIQRKRQHDIINFERADRNYFMNLTLEGKEKCANEVVERLTTSKVRLLRAESSKGQP